MIAEPCGLPGKEIADTKEDEEGRGADREHDEEHRAGRDAKRDAGSGRDRLEDQDGADKDKRLVQREVPKHRDNERDGNNPRNKKEYDAGNRAGCPRIYLQVHGLITSIVAPALKYCATETVRFFLSGSVQHIFF